MKMRRTHIRRGGEELTPLINVVFLLLIFVVLAGEVVETAPFSVDPPEVSKGGATAFEAPTIYLGPTGQLSISGKLFSPVDIAAVLAALPNGGSTEIVVEADRTVGAAVAIELVEELQKSGTRRIRLVTSPGGP